MIGSLRGSVLERLDDGRVLVEVGGVGYLVTVTPRTLAELEPTSPVFLYVHHHIREDTQTLFGFLRRDERAAFDVLIATHGIGPALAVAILGTHSPTALVDIVAGKRSRRADAGAGRRQEDRRATAGRASQPAQPADARPDDDLGRRQHRRSAMFARHWRSRLCVRGDPRRDARPAGLGVGRRSAARCSATAGGPTCVRSSSIRRPPTMSKRPTRRVYGPGG